MGRQMRRIGCLLLWLASVLVGRGEADAQDPARGLDAESLVQRAMRQNGELLAARQQVEAARASITQAGLRPNPMIEISGLQQVRGSDNNISAGATLPLELFGRRARRLEIAERELALMQLELDERERQFAASVRAKYGESLAAIRNLHSVEDLLGLNRETLRLISARVERGATAPLEANIERVEVSRLEAMKAEIEGRVQIGLLELRNLVGMRSDEPLVLEGDLSEVRFQIPPPEEIAKAMADRPDVRAAKAAEELAGARLRQARVEGLPDASVFANFQRMDLGFDLNGLGAANDIRRVQGVFHYLTFGLSLSLPVRNRNQGAIQAATAQMEAARHRRTFAELVAAREVTVALVRYDKAQQSVEIYARGVREQARSNLRVIRQTYDFGQIPFIEVVGEQRRYLETETGFTEALNQRYQSMVELRRALGTPVR